MNNDGFLDDDTIRMKIGNVPTRVGERDLVDLIRVDLDLALSVF